MEAIDRKYVYFLGIGGIGMSALARYFNHLGRAIAGYDRTSTELTKTLESEGMFIHYKDEVSMIPAEFIKNAAETLVVYTPAVPADHSELIYLKDKGFEIFKRSRVLGLIFNRHKGVAVAGTHGKTTVSTLVSHLMVHGNLNTIAFLGGISKNYHSNLILGQGDEYVVAEADEFDRSFLQLSPQLAIITSCDADHLDIYGSHEEVIKSFDLFAKQVKQNGILIMKKGLPLAPAPGKNVKVYTYSAMESADFHAMNHHYSGGKSRFDLKTPKGIEQGLELVLPGKANIENSVAALAAGILLGIPMDSLRRGLASFTGVVRRFDIQFIGSKLTYIDDYAHHPEELKAIINAAREMFPGKKLTGIFQPHLFTRTRDFADGFAESLDQLDELIMLEIYPARELPIKGVNSEMILSRMKNKNHVCCNKKNLMKHLDSSDFEILLTLGAGDIDTLIGPIKEFVVKKDKAIN
jgi:UDP-N-acetylmuramate--alanine ligase